VAAIHNQSGPEPKGWLDYDGKRHAERYFHNSDHALETGERIAAADPMLYTPKADRWQREAGLTGEAQFLATMGDGIGLREHNPKEPGAWRLNNHPTVKPLTLCHWLASLLLPPDAYAPRRLLVPFSGSGSEMIGALLAGWDHVQGVEIEREYIDIARQRIDFWQQYAGMDYDTARQYAEAKQEQLEREARMNAPLDDLPLFGGTYKGED
jgi:site-specific DNA-methyltransferase (adenine-specific)